MSERPKIMILGAGPAGVGAASRLARRGLFDITVVEQRHVVGGNAGSFELCGQRVDYGSHRLHPACDSRILADIRTMLGADLLDRPRHGRIRLRGRWLHFPLKPVDLALNLPSSFMLGVMRDSILRPRNGNHPPTFATTLEQGLGRTICRDFYFPYAEKIWGVSPAELDVEQARRRVSANSLLGMVRKVAKMVPGFKTKGAGRFFYPLGLFKTEVIRRRGPWRHIDAVEFATLAWVDWFNTRRLLEPIGYIPPAEYEERYYEQVTVT